MTTSGAYCKASRRDDGGREGLRLSFWDKCGLMFGTYFRFLRISGAVQFRPRLQNY